MYTRLLLITLLIPLLFSCKSKQKEPQAQSSARKPNMPLTVDGYIVVGQSLDESIEVPGNLLAAEATEIHPEIAGRITALRIQEGAYVAKGTLLAKIYDGDLQAQLKKLRIQLQIAQKTEQRQAELLKIQGISQQDYDLSLLQVQTLRADMDIINSNIVKTEIRAPFSGKLGLRNISPGAYITPASILSTIRQLNQLKIDFTVPEKYATRINPGTMVYFTLEGSPVAHAARVVATESEVEQSTRNLNIRAVVQGSSENLLPGAFAKVKIAFPPNPNALLVPTQAIIPQARGKKVALFNNGTATFVQVETGVRDSTFIQITNGIKIGDTVITSGLLSLKPEGKIKAGKISYR